MTQRANTLRAFWPAATLALLLLAALWLIHRAAFSAPFYFDTVAHLERKANLHLVELSWAGLNDSLRFYFGGRLYRPLAQLSLALTHWGFGLQPEAYRIGNLAIHWLSAVAVFFLALTVLELPRVRRTLPVAGGSVLLAGLAAVLWALHPIHTNVVSYVIQRMASLCGLFTFLAVASYLRARSATGGWSWRWFGTAVGAFALAMASKENAVAVLAVLPACEWALLDAPDRRLRRWLYGGFALACAGGLLVALLHLPELARLVSHHHRPFTLGQRLLTEARLQIDYLGILLLPLPGSLILTPDVPVSTGLLAPPQTALALLGLGGALLLALAGARRAPLASFCVLWYVATQLPEATVIPLELYYEHRMYIPSVGLALLSAQGVAWIAGRLRPSWLALLLAPLLVAEGAATAARTRTWADPVRFWAESAAAYPSSPRILTNLAWELRREGRRGEASQVLRRALTLPEAKGWVIHLQLGRLAFESGDYAAARDHWERSEERVSRNNWRAPQRLGLLALREGALEAAEGHLRRSLERDDKVAETWRLLGAAHLLRGNNAEAEAALQAAVRYGPGNAEVWNTLGAFHYRAGRYPDAEAAYERAGSLAPENGEYLKNLAKARARLLEQAAREGGR